MPLIQTVVQHDPRRAHLLPPLLKQLPATTVVVNDPAPDDPRRSPWRTYKACLRALDLARFKTVSHLLIIQDDAQLCRDFAAAVEMLCVTHPDDPLVFFVPGVGSNQRLIMNACYAEQRWAELDPRSWVPVVCVLWPRRQAHALLEFAEGKDYGPGRTADDAIVGDFSRETGTRFLASVPSLVEHPDQEQSLVGTANFGGLSPARIAACWLGEELSPLDFSW